MEITHPEQVRKYYQNKKVAEGYIAKRFREPLNQWEHRKQALILNKIIKDTQAKNILELASGPARITTELEAEGGTSIDASREMLRLARKRMKERGKRWTFLQGDILDWEKIKDLIPGRKHKEGKSQEKIDLIFSLRFFLHFQRREREKFYRQAGRLLKDGGYLVFEVMNKKTVLPLRRLLGIKRYFVYDKLYSKMEFLAEMEANGFKVLRLYPVLNHFWLQALLSRPLKFLGGKEAAVKVIAGLEEFPSNNPYQWIALCQKQGKV